MSAEAYIVSGARTPVAPRNGFLKGIDIYTLGEAAASCCLVKAGIASDKVDEIIVGNVLGPGGNPGRVISLQLGLPEATPGITIDRQCASGLDAILLAKSLITSGLAEIVLVGGVESYSQRPRVYLQKNGEYEDSPIDQAPFTPWSDRDPDMIKTASDLAEKYSLTRESQDLWAIDSHEKARASKHRLQEEMSILLGIPRMDQFTRNLTLETCQKIAPICGTITPANTSVAADGAAFVLVVSEQIANELNAPKVRIASGLTVGSDPMVPGLATMPAIRKVLKMEGLNSDGILVYEIMEAFSAQILACLKDLDIDPSRVNTGGGSLARGHPIGASGTILAVRLFHELLDTGGFGLASIPSAGGIGTAIIFERE
ncbi:MAG: thiolase family protein [Rhodobacteraceae bacterium]|nr:thiolase family protein [Paracoccaceae bacterium]MCY4248831.1 thiolase family protein [Paracoccaceae bacterium]